MGSIARMVDELWDPRLDNGGFLLGKLLKSIY